jgi:hypothetical protein
MSTYSYGQFEMLLRKIGFLRTRTGDHNLWERTGPNGKVDRVILCARSLRCIPTQVLPRLLRHAGLSEEDLLGSLRP